LSVPLTSWHMLGESGTPLFSTKVPDNFSQLSHLEPQTNLSTTFEMNAPSVAVQKHIDSPNGKSIRKWLAKFQGPRPLPRPHSLALNILAAHTQRSVTLGANFAISTLANVQIKMLKGSCSTQLHALVTISPTPLFLAVCVTCVCVCERL